MSHPDITFDRLPVVPLSTLCDQMNDPRVATHLPLLTSPWTDQEARQFVDLKEACWIRDGLGHWAIFADGRYVGWGGFQKEGLDWDFGLVLMPDSFGLGLRIFHKALAFAKQDARIPGITFLLPPTRRHLGALKKIGATQLADTILGGERFLKFRLETSDEMT